MCFIWSTFRVNFFICLIYFTPSSSYRSLSPLFFIIFLLFNSCSCSDHTVFSFPLTLFPTNLLHTYHSLSLFCKKIQCRFVLSVFPKSAINLPRATDKKVPAAFSIVKRICRSLARGFLPTLSSTHTPYLHV